VKSFEQIIDSDSQLKNRILYQQFSCKVAFRNKPYPFKEFSKCISSFQIIFITY